MHLQKQLDLQRRMTVSCEFSIRRSVVSCAPRTKKVEKVTQTAVSLSMWSAGGTWGGRADEVTKMKKSMSPLVLGRRDFSRSHLPIFCTSLLSSLVFASSPRKKTVAPRSVPFRHFHSTVHTSDFPSK